MGFTDRVQDALGETIHSRGGTLVEDLVDGLTGELDDTDDLIGPTDRGWAPVYDLDLTPYPGWLGQATGTPAPDGLDTEAQRDYVRRRLTTRSGTPRAIAAALWPFLTGTQQVGFRERDGSPWRVTLVVFDSQTTLTAEQIKNVVALQKPIGIILDVDLVADGYAIPTRWLLPDTDYVSYARMAHLSPDYDEWAVDFPTYADAITYEEP